MVGELERPLAARRGPKHDRQAANPRGRAGAPLRRWPGATAALLATLLAPLSSSAQSGPQPAPEQPAPAPSTPAEAAPAPARAQSMEVPVSEAVRQEALMHFEKGFALLNEGAWSPGLSELLLSRKLFPTRIATYNAAVALRKLQRYDEALDMFETYLRDFPVSGEEREEALRQIAELRTLVGTIELVGAETGAVISVDGQDRGQYPPIRPLRVPAGNHMLRVFKEGYDPFVIRVDVAGGQTKNVQVTLRRLARYGSLRVIESSGKPVSVSIDGIVVGKAPWTGILSVGDHEVTLRGEGKVGTQPASASVKSQSVTTLSLLAEELDAVLHVEPVPIGASVWINSVKVGDGVWIGRLKQGTHRVEVRANGYLADAQSVTLSKGGRQKLRVSLDRDEDAEVWSKPPKLTLDATASFLIAPTFGGDLASGCGEACESSIGLGALGMIHGGYEFGSGFGVGLEAGGIFAVQSLENRTASVVPVGVPPVPSAGTANDALRLGGFLVGVTAGYHVGERFPALFRIGAGALLGEVRDERAGTFELSRTPVAVEGEQARTTFDAAPQVDFPWAAYIYLDPEVRFGLRLSERFELSAGVKLLMLLALRKPTWDGTRAIPAGIDGVATYPAESVMGDFALMVAPGASLRYTF
ncbi:PEGA domain-containing protein [Sorangium sp. So ce1151]|uniref:PEGA domain-containing protein n=1 Tax=Sorangium sp. So ce1151 TaxID=3133332 RepID=UPI003F605A16